MDGAPQPEQAESKRDRVRRLLLEPLAADGFRHRRGDDPDKARDQLDRVADALAYMSDDQLAVLRVALATKGEGAAHCFWPSYATIVGLAEAFAPRPVEELPELVRWFRSAAGSAALTGDRLVAEYLFFRKRKRPPLRPAEQAMIAERAAGWRRRLVLIAEREGRGLAPDADDLAFRDWYRGLEARVAALVGEAAA